MNLGEQPNQAGPVNDIRAGAESARGLREENQDAMTRFLSRYGEVILVADGMGGHQGGATASDMVAKRFRLHLESMPPEMPLADALQHATVRINDEIFERGHSGDPSVSGMGSTLVLAVLVQGPSGWEVTVANAGDSRAYLVRDGVLRQLMKDHTAVQRMIDAGMLTEENARHHPNASVLTRALGQQQGTTVEVYPPVPLLAGDGLLLCSDGLSGYVVDSEISRVIASVGEPNNIVRSLVETALKAGSDDNITVQFLRLGDKVAPLGAVAPPPMAMPPPAPSPAYASAPPPLAPPPPAGAGRGGSAKGRIIALAIILVAAAGGVVIALNAGKWFGGDKKDTAQTSTPATKSHPSTPAQRGGKGSGAEKGTGQPQQTPPMGENHPNGTPIPPTTAPAPNKPIEIHVPEGVKKPDWIDDLKKKLPGLTPFPFSKEEIKEFTPAEGIRISYHPSMSADAENLVRAIHEIEALKDIRLESVMRPDMERKQPNVGVLIVAAERLYKQPAIKHTPPIQ